jgi:hypothetical protein
MGKHAVKQEPEIPPADALKMLSSRNKLARRFFRKAFYNAIFLHYENLEMAINLP